MYLLIKNWLNFAKDVMHKSNLQHDALKNRLLDICNVHFLNKIAI